MLSLFMPQAYSDASAWAPLLPGLEADLDIEVIKEEEREGVVLRWLRFYSHDIDGEAVRVYAVYVRPKTPQTKLPAILRIHGGGGTAEPEVPMYLAKRGYASMSYDWTGPTRANGRSAGRAEDEVTVWPEGLAGMAHGSAPTEQVKFYHSLFTARRAITFLRKQEEVDPDNIGVVGESWGASHIFRLNAMEDRVKVMVPIYGVYADLSSKSWQQRFGAMAQVKNQKAPLFLLGPSNDFGMDNFVSANQFMSELEVDNRFVWIANEDHGVRPAAVAAGMRFFDQYLKGDMPLPKQPELRLQQSGNQVELAMHAPDAQSASFYVSYGSPQRPAGGSWLSIPRVEQQRRIFRASIPLPDGVESVHAYGQAQYADGVELSTLVASAEGANPTETFQPRSKVLYDPAWGIEPWCFHSNTHGHGFRESSTVVEIRPGSLDPSRKVLVMENLPTPKEAWPSLNQPRFNDGLLRTPADPLRAPQDNASLVIECYVPERANVQVAVSLGDPDNPRLMTRRMKTSKVSRDVTFNGSWQSLEFKAHEFTDASGKPLQQFDDIRAIRLKIVPNTPFHPEVGKLYWKN